MKHTQILKRAWAILWSYKTLWIFGIILALTAGSTSGNSGSGSGWRSGNNNGQGFNFNFPSDLNRQFGRLGTDLSRVFEEFSQRLGHVEVGVWIAIAAAVLVVLLALAVLFAFARYISEVALIRMVDKYEDSGEKVNWKQGFRLGWSRSAWRLFLINLVIGLPMVVIFMILFGAAAAPVILGSLRGTPSVISIISTIGMGFLAIFLFFLVILAISVLINIIYRECVLQNLGVFASIRQGYQKVRSHFKDVILMWLILVGVQIGFTIVLIPVVLLLVGIGLLLGGGVGVGLFFAVQTAGQIVWPLIVAIMLGSIVFITVLSLPLLFFGGLLQTYLSTSWTLAYRDITPKPLPEVEPLPDTSAPAEALPDAG